jgi:hypothetical protein
MVAAAQAKAGNPERARALYEEALTGFANAGQDSEIAAARAELKALERVTAERTLRGPMTAARGAGG